MIKDVFSDDSQGAKINTYPCSSLGSCWLQVIENSRGKIVYSTNVILMQIKKTKVLGGVCSWFSRHDNFQTTYDYESCINSRCSILTGTWMTWSVFGSSHQSSPESSTNICHWLTSSAATPLKQRNVRPASQDRFKSKAVRLLLSQADWKTLVHLLVVGSFSRPQTEFPIFQLLRMLNIPNVQSANNQNLVMEIKLQKNRMWLLEIKFAACLSTTVGCVHHQVFIMPWFGFSW